MAGVRQIFYRRRTAENICRMTRTMGIISTAKYKYFLNKRTAIVDYQNSLAKIAYLLTTAVELVEHPLLKFNGSARRSAIFAIGSVRGLCGSYNDSVGRLVQMHVERAAESGRKLDVYVTDGRLISVLRHRGIVPTKIFPESELMFPNGWIDEIANEFVCQYIAGEIDDFEVVYTYFHSVASQRAQTLHIMPFVEFIDDLATRATVIWPWELTFENFLLSPPTNEIIEELAKTLIRMSMHCCLIDAILSEHVARMLAMKNATENAEDMIRDLTGEYNKARQSQITRELLDIIGGTGVLG